MYQYKYNCKNWQNKCMQTIKTSQRRLPNSYITTKNNYKNRTNNWNCIRNPSYNFYCPITYLVPWKRISCNSKRDCTRRYNNSCNPCKFSRTFEPTCQIYSKNMKNYYYNYQIGRPTMNRTNQPPKIYFCYDILNRKESIYYTWTIIKCYSKSRCNLNQKASKCYSSNTLKNIYVRRYVFTCYILSNQLNFQAFLEPRINFPHKVYVLKSITIINKFLNLILIKYYFIEVQ